MIKLTRLAVLAALLTMGQATRADDSKSAMGDMNGMAGMPGMSGGNDTNNVPAVKAKPYPLKSCLVCGMKFDAADKPYAFVYKGQEIKVCDKSEEADFNKDPDKYMKELAEAEAKLKK